MDDCEGLSGRCRNFAIAAVDICGAAAQAWVPVVRARHDAGLAGVCHQTSRPGRGLLPESDAGKQAHRRRSQLFGAGVAAGTRERECALGGAAELQTGAHGQDGTGDGSTDFSIFLQNQFHDWTLAARLPVRSRQMGCYTQLAESAG